VPGSGSGPAGPRHGRQHGEQIVAPRREPRHLCLDLGDVAAQQAFRASPTFTPEYGGECTGGVGTPEQT
jgi:hypothetical protein